MSQRSHFEEARERASRRAIGMASPLWTATAFAVGLGVAGWWWIQVGRRLAQGGVLASLPPPVPSPAPEPSDREASIGIAPPPPPEPTDAEKSSPPNASPESRGMVGVATPPPDAPLEGVAARSVPAAPKAMPEPALELEALASEVSVAALTDGEADDPTAAPAEVTSEPAPKPRARKKPTASPGVGA